MSDRDDDIERICQEALDRAPAARSAFVAETCRGDEALRREVESLLAQETAVDRFIETPALQVTARQLGHGGDEHDRSVPTSGWAWGVTIRAGSRFGPYEIRSPIGAGGMGEVYSARDTGLQRDVALKVLPETFAVDPERARRFQDEAQMLASLNHPNIAIIYGLEETNGIRALVLELVEGPTLADRIARGPIPLDEALQIARQIVEALAAAHQKRIIHRDLKPANIKVRPDGTVKVLDFGLAKMFETQPAGATASNLPVRLATMPGTLLGTAAYMSPEQAKGQETDCRADVWAFGCVLFEMLTGRVLFEGDTSGEIVADVLKSDPDWRRLPPGTPEALRRLLRRCLQKDRRLRLHDMADVRIEVEEASSSPRGELPNESGVRHGRERLAWISAVAVLASTLAATGTWALRGVRSDAGPPEMRVEITTPPTTDPLSLEISPDGRHVVFVATFEGRPRLWLRALDGVAARPLPGTDFAAYPFWSPDSRSIGFFADLRLKRLDIDGGTVQPLARIEVGFGGTWTRDGAILFSSGPARPIFRIGETGGDVVPVTRLGAQQVGHRFPHILPDGRHFLYYVAGTPEIRGVYVAHLDGSDARELFPADSAAIYASSGHLLFVRQGTLHAVRFNPATLAIAGSPFSVAERVAMDGGFGRAALSASTTGLVLYRETSAGGRQQFIWFDRTGREIRKLGEAGNTGPAHPSLSPDGGRVAMTRAVGGNTDVWLLDTTRGSLSRFTSEPSTEIYPIWSPDGSRVVYASNRRVRGGLELYQKSAAASGRDELLPTVDGLATAIPDDWSRDGRFIIFQVIMFQGLGDTKTGFDLWALPLKEPGKPFAVANTEFEERDAQFSPDGKWVAYDSDESGRFEVYAQPFPGPGAKAPISTGGGSQVRWSRDGKELFYIALDGRLMAVPIRAASNRAALDAGPPVPLFATRILGGLPGQGNQRQQYMVSPDGQHFLVYSVVAEETSPIIVILNWKPRLDAGS
jgi:serine/threonine protein kinase/Tol biopolymer transport system component